MSRSTVTPSKPIAVYTRVSEQGRRSDEELVSHDIQRTKVGSYLDALGLTASKGKFEDNSRSGRKMSRPAFDKIMDGIREGRLGGIAVYKLSRFGRNVQGVLALVRELDALGAQFVCVQPAIDTSTANGRFMLTVFAALDELEAERAVEEAGVLIEKKLDEGLTTGGLAATGYMWEVTGQDTNGKNLLGWLAPGPDFEVVKDIRLRFASGALKTPYAVAAALNEASITTSRGGTWNQRNTLGFLRNPTYTGDRWYAGQRIAAGTHEAMHDHDVQRVIERKVEPKKTRKPYVRGEGHVLGEGLLRCAECGAGMVQSNGNGTMTLRCSSGLKGHASISYAPAQAWIEQFAFSAAALGNDAEDYAGVVQSIRSRSSLVQEVEAAREAVASTAEMLGVEAHEVPANAAVAKTLAKAEDALTEFDLAAQDDGSAAQVLTRAEYDALDTTGKRRALHDLLSEVVVLKGKQGQRIANIALYDRLVLKFRNGVQVPAAEPKETPTLAVVEGGAQTKKTRRKAAVAS